MTQGTDTCHGVMIRRLNVKSMKIFLSYGHDSNAPLIERIKEYLSKDAERNLKPEVWMDKSEINSGKGWREKKTKGVLGSNVVHADLWNTFRECWTQKIVLNPRPSSYLGGIWISVS